MPSQAASGKAWEYSLARRLARINSVPILPSNAQLAALKAYHEYSEHEQGAFHRAAVAAANFLQAHDERFGELAQLEIQSDQRGKDGDVRDVLAATKEGSVIGISAKHRHRALKHSRLSDNIDFGLEWYGRPCSAAYWGRVKPVFSKLRRSSVGYWRELPDKHEGYYQSVLAAFMEEVLEYADAERLLRYVVGRYDFYKVIKSNGDVEIQSFNLGGSLQWGAKLPMPTRIVEFRREPSRVATAVLTLDHGWQLSFRLHNANAEIEPSLKFDIQLVGSPEEMGNYTIPY